MARPAPSVGFLEFSSLATGYQAADDILKAAPVRVHLARPVSPGKFLLLFSGEPAEVTHAVRAGRQGREGELLGEFVLHNFSPEVFDALAGKPRLDSAAEAVGVVEATAVAPILEAADRSAKRAAVRILRVRCAQGLGGKSFFIMEGTYAEVESALAEAAQVLRRRGAYLRHVLIGQMHPEMREILDAELEGWDLT